MRKRRARPILLSVFMLSIAFILSIGIIYAKASRLSSPLAVVKYWVPSAQVHIPEEDPGYRWPHNFGQTTTVTYRWGDYISGRSQIAFEQGIEDWDNAPTLINLVYDSYSQNTLNSQYDDQIHEFSYCLIYPDIYGNPLYVHCYINEYWIDYYGYNDTQLRALAAHETGHLQLVGEIPDYYRAWEPLMSAASTPEELDLFYFPQGEDIRLANRVYP